jgi:hypothetical protein
LVFIFLEQTKTSTLKIVNLYFVFLGFADFFKCMKNKQKEIAERERKLTLGSGGPPPS